MKNRALLSLILFFLLVQTALFSSNQSELIPEKDFKEYFNWKFITRTPMGEIKSINYEEIFNMDDSREFQIKLIIKKAVYIYMFIYDSDYNLDLIYPKELSAIASQYDAGKEYHIPEEKKWLSLRSNTQVKNFYMLASETPITDIERLISEYSNLLKNNTSDEIKKIKGTILSKLNQLELENNYFTKTAEQPLPIAGDVKTESNREDLLWGE